MRLRLLAVPALSILAGACATFEFPQFPIEVSGPPPGINAGPDGSYGPQAMAYVPEPVTPQVPLSEARPEKTPRAASGIDMPNPPVPSLSELVAATPPATEKSEDPEDRLRGPAMREAALSYGARGGLAWASQAINDMLSNRAADLTRIYDFERLLITGPGGVTALPPVISEATETWESFEAGKALRVADTVYEIVAQSRFTPVAPLWHAYLVRQYESPEPPLGPLLPKTEAERSSWAKWVADGWKMGVKQARDIFQSDLNRLERDYTGMIRYKVLLEQGKVSAPVIAEGAMGVTGSGLDMRVNDRSIRITRDPILETDASRWNARPSGMNPGEAARPPSARHVEQSLLDEASASARADLAPASEALDRVTEVKRDPTPADMLPKPAPEEKPAKEKVSKPATAKKTASKAPRRF